MIELDWNPPFNNNNNNNIKCPWGEEESNLISELGRRVSVVKAGPRSTHFLRQRISVAIQRGNAACILATVPRDILS